MGKFCNIGMCCLLIDPNALHVLLPRVFYIVLIWLRAQHLILPSSKLISGIFIQRGLYRFLARQHQSILWSADLSGVFTPCLTSEKININKKWSQCLCLKCNMITIFMFCSIESYWSTIMNHATKSSKARYKEEKNTIQVFVLIRLTMLITLIIYDAENQCYCLVMVYGIPIWNGIGLGVIDCHCYWDISQIVLRDPRQVSVKIVQKLSDQFTTLSYMCPTE